MELYQANWTSLLKTTVPDWMLDAKFDGEGDDRKFVDEADRFSQWDLNALGAEDKRYTRSKDGRTVYAFALGKPEGRVVFEALGQGEGLLESPITSVQRLGGAEAKWQQTPQGLVIDPDSSGELSDAAVVWKVRL